MSVNQDPIVVIGGGMSGIMAARTLLEAGEENVLLLEKGRNVGGRMVTRELGGSRIDHGVQFFNAASPLFYSYIEEWVSRGWVRELKGSPGSFTGVEGMSALARHLADPIDFCVRVRVTKVQEDREGWVLSWISEEQAYVSQTYGEVPKEEVYDPGKEARIHARAIIMAIPVPQALELLQKGKVELDGAVIQTLQQIRYLPCLSAFLVLDGESDVPDPGYILTGLPYPVRLMFDNKQKGITDVPSLTIQAAEDWSRDHFWNRDEEILSELISIAKPWIGECHILSQHIRRWTFSLADQTHRKAYLDSGMTFPLVFAGDAFIAAEDPLSFGRVETAALSGIEAARHLLSRQGK